MGEFRRGHTGSKLSLFEKARIGEMLKKGLETNVIAKVLRKDVRVVSNFVDPRVYIEPWHYEHHLVQFPEKMKNNLELEPEHLEKLNEIIRMRIAQGHRGMPVRFPTPLEKKKKKQIREKNEKKRKKEKGSSTDPVR